VSQQEAWEESVLNRAPGEGKGRKGKKICRKEPTRSAGEKGIGKGAYDKGCSVLRLE